jgi:hypothetical protein
MKGKNIKENMKNKKADWEENMGRKRNGTIRADKSENG